MSSISLVISCLFVSYFVLVSVASCASLERFPPVSLAQSGLLVLFLTGLSMGGNVFRELDTGFRLWCLRTLE